jgi:hypothetical protein
MMLIPGFLIAFLTFPGVIVHTLIQQLVCALFQIPVLEVTYYTLKGESSLQYENPNSPWVKLLICIAPLFGNSLIGFLIAAPASFVALLGAPANASQPYLFLNYFMIWLGVAIAAHAFPKLGSATNLWEELKRPGQSPLFAVVGYPVVGLAVVLAGISVVWADFIYAVLLTIFLPDFLIKLFV